MKQYLWTLNGARLQYQSAHNNGDTNWLFMPGGPGLGSEALTGLTGILKDKIPGVIWHFDLPNDGSNNVKDKPISDWRASLIQTITAFERVILVAHSSLGMYVQTMPELEAMLHGLVLIGSAPDASWQNTFAEYCRNDEDSLMLDAEKKYAGNPSDESLRTLLISQAKYCFTNQQSLIAGIELIKKLPVNHAASELYSDIFNSKTYEATWIPQQLPTLIIGGSTDHIISLELFKKNNRYRRNNILIKEISDAGHYPWFENPKEIIMAFENYCSIFNL